MTLASSCVSPSDCHGFCWHRPVNSHNVMPKLHTSLALDHSSYFSPTNFNWVKWVVRIVVVLTYPEERFWSHPADRQRSPTVNVVIIACKQGPVNSHVAYLHRKPLTGQTITKQNTKLYNPALDCHNKLTIWNSFTELISHGERSLVIRGTSCPKRFGWPCK